MKGKRVTPGGGSGFGPLIEGDELKAAFRRRRDEFEYSKVPHEEEQRYTQQNWTEYKRTQTHVWVKKRKNADSMLADRIWCLFYRMGYLTLNGPKFQIEYKAFDGVAASKRIDVFAKDDETVLVVESIRP
jgi:DNA sulfur modification protein DndB